MKTRRPWAAIVKFAGATILVSSLLLLGVVRSTEKHKHPAGVGLSAAAASATANLPRAKSDAKWIEAYGKLPLSFEQNLGQTAEEVRFVSHGTGYALFLTSQEAVISLPPSRPNNLSALHRMAYFRALRKARRAGRMTVLRMRLEGSNPAAQIAGIDLLPGKVNYFIGNNPKDWRTEVPSYARVKYAGIYPGVDLVFYGNQRHLEYDFVVAPGADPKVIELSLKGTQKVRVNSNGDLVLSVSGGQVVLQKPVIYQNVSGGRHEIHGRYVLAGDRRVTFAVANYDRSAPLFIDPVLNYSTYLGGSALGDSGAAIAVDSLGDAFVTGTTFSTTFPSTPGGFGAGNANGVAFVTEINPTGTALLYTTYLGGTGGDFGLGIALDNSGNSANPGGNIYVTGGTFSTDFPTTAVNALKPGPNAGASLGTSFISKINPAASGIGSLVYSSYLGGTDGTSLNPDVGNAVAADVNGNAYVTGLTASSPGLGLANFPVTAASAFQTSLGSSDGNAFLTRIDTTQSGGASLAYSTYLGGSGANAASSGLQFGELAQGVAVDSSENAFIVGITTSTDFPTTNTNAFQPNTAPPAAVANGTAFVSRIDTSTTKTPATSLVYSTYLGGENQDLSAAIALKPGSEVVYVTGTTNSLLFPTFPTAPRAPYQTAGTTGGSAFLSAIDTGQIGIASLTYSTYLGGARTDGFCIAADAVGNVYIGGGTSFPGFPVTPGAFQPTFAPGATGEGFISKLNPGGNGAADLVYSSFFGGSGSGSLPDSVYGIAIDHLNNAYLTGITYSSAATFPVFPPTAFQTSLNGLSDAFIAKLTLIPTLVVSPTALNFGPILVQSTSPAQTLTLTNNTNATITFASATLTNGNPAAATTDYVISANTCSGGIPSGAPPANQCTISVTFKPSVAGAETATLVLTDGDSTSPQNISLTGSGSNISPLTVMPTSLNFGPIPIQNTSPAQAVTLTNNANATIAFASATLTNGNPAAATTDYVISANTCSGGIPSGAPPANQCTISVTFKPSVAGAETATLVLTDGDSTSPQNIALSGTGTNVGVGLAPTSLAFGGQMLTTTSAAKPVTLTNTGTGPLTINTIAASGDFAETSTGTGACPISPATLAAGVNCTINVTFAPTAVGARVGTLTVADSASGSPHTVALTGSGWDFTVAAPPSLTLKDGQTGNFTVTVTPQGGFNQAVTVACTGAPALATCTPATPVTPADGVTAVTSAVTVTTHKSMLSPPTIPTPPKPLSLRQLVPLLLALFLFLSIFMTRRLRTRLGIVTAIVILITLAGCGSGGPSTPKGTTNLTITCTSNGTAGTVNHTAIVALTVN
jgi:hypothetical protein